MTKKFAVMAERCMAGASVDGAEYHRLLAPIAKTFEVDGYTFHIVKIYGKWYRCIESETGAPIGEYARTISEARANGDKALDRGNRKAMLETCVERWLSKYGRAADLPCATTSL